MVNESFADWLHQPRSQNKLFEFYSGNSGFDKGESCFGHGEFGTCNYLDCWVVEVLWQLWSRQFWRRHKSLGVVVFVWIPQRALFWSVDEFCGSSLILQGYFKISSTESAPLRKWIGTGGTPVENPTGQRISPRPKTSTLVSSTIDLVVWLSSQVI